MMMVFRPEKATKITINCISDTSHLYILSSWEQILQLLRQMEKLFEEELFVPGAQSCVVCGALFHSFQSAKWKTLLAPSIKQQLDITGFLWMHSCLQYVLMCSGSLTEAAVIYHNFKHKSANMEPTPASLGKGGLTLDKSPVHRMADK